MSWAQDITGERYGKLVALKCVGINVHKRRIWLCRCDCGNEVNVLANSLKTGRTISCGCFIKQKNKETFIKHGKVKTPEYKAWASMKVRCYNHNGIEWLRYGGRGISVCGR